MPGFPNNRRGSRPRGPGPWAQARRQWRLRLKTGIWLVLTFPAPGADMAAMVPVPLFGNPRLHVCAYTYKRPPRGTAIIVSIRDRAVGMPAERSFNALDFLSDRGPPRFAGIHGWIDEVMNDKEELQFLSLFWNCRGKKLLDPKRCCHIRPCVPEDAEGVVKGGQIIGVDHWNRRFAMEHLGDMDCETEETRVGQQSTPPRTSIPHPGGARAGRWGAGGPPGIPGREFPGDPKEEMHDWMTNLWAREHELDSPPARNQTEFEQLRDLVLHLRGVVEGEGNTRAIADTLR